MAVSANFKIGMNSLEVAQEIVRCNPEIKEITLVQHMVEINWRQKHLSIYAKLKNINDCFTESKQTASKAYSRSDFLKLTLNDLKCPLNSHLVWSFSSKVLCNDGTCKHIPMMNFHSHFPEISNKDLISVAKCIQKDTQGVLLETGRYTHYYGNALIEEKKWPLFVGQFLMPTFVVSERYVGHAFYNGFCTLRLTVDEKFKPKLPIVVEVINK